MREWAIRFQELTNKEITQEEYFEWKSIGLSPVMTVGGLSQQYTEEKSINGIFYLIAPFANINN